MHLFGQCWNTPAQHGIPTRCPRSTSQKLCKEKLLDLSPESIAERPVWLDWCRSFNGELCRSDRLVARLAMFYKAVNGQAACHIPQDFPPTASRTRSSHNIQYHLPHKRLDCYKFSFFPRTIRAWNILPTQLVQAPDTENFKTQLQQHFTSGLMYMVPPRGHYQRPRLGSSGCVSGVGPIY